MLTLLEKYAEVTNLTLKGTSQGDLINFFEGSVGTIHIESAYLDCLFDNTRKRRIMREVPREQWRVVKWRQTWNGLDGSIFDPWDEECIFFSLYTFFPHLRWLIRKSIEDPYSSQMLPLKNPSVSTHAFLRLPGIKPAEIRIHGNKHDSREWMIDLISWRGYPRVWHGGNKVLIPAR